MSSLFIVYCVKALRDIFEPNGLFWFRTCETMKGVGGRDFANRLAGIDAVSVTRMIDVTLCMLQRIFTTKSQSPVSNK